MTGSTTQRLLAIAGLMACTATAGAEFHLPVNATVDQTLDALHDRGSDLRAFTADLRLTETDNTMGTDTTKTGHVWFEQPPGGDARMRVLFDHKQAAKREPVAERKEYLLENGWLTDRDYHNSNEVRRQIARPGEKVNLFQLGKGPFPLPIGQDRKSVESTFDLTVVPAAADDPASSIHLHLIPKAGNAMARKFSELDIWVDRTTRMPSRIRTSDVNGTTDRVTDLDNMKVNPTPELTGRDFELPPIGPKWDSHDEKFED